MAKRILRQHITVYGRYYRVIAAAATALLACATVLAGPFAQPGDNVLRHDLQLLNDSGAIHLLLTTWPIAWHDIELALQNVDQRTLRGAQANAFRRVLDAHREATRAGGTQLEAGFSLASNPSIVRSFEDTPRDNGAADLYKSWSGSRFSIDAKVSLIANAMDDESIRLDSTVLTAQISNWTLAAGWQSRWWGPGNDGSLILSNNARPLPSVSLQRSISYPFETRLLNWMGPWSLITFMGYLDDEREIDDALLFGVRGTIRPAPGLEIGLSRTAQWCGGDRPCGGSVFLDMLLGRDNRGVNVDSRNEPGNQLGGFDVRWNFPRNLPLALNLQWIAEDTRQGGPEIGSWLRQIGLETWGTLRDISHRTHIEVSDTSCHAGGFGFSEIEPDCAYEHEIYRTGYRYIGRSIGHAVDGDGLSYSLGSTLVQFAGHTWGVLVRYTEVNRVGGQSANHSLAELPQTLSDFRVSHSRETTYGRFRFMLGVSNTKISQNGQWDLEPMAFLQWRSNER